MFHIKKFICTCNLARATVLKLAKRLFFLNLAFEQEVTQALKLGCKEGVFIFRNIEGEIHDFDLIMEKYL